MTRNSDKFPQLLIFFIGISLAATHVLADQRPLIIAHRGASGYLPEHTLAAVSLAYGMGADYIEQDVVLSKDRIPVVLHDIHIDTVTNASEVFPNRSRTDGRFYAIDFTLAELKSLDVNERVDVKTGKRVFPGRFPKGLSQFRIPTLEEEIEMIQGLNQSSQGHVGIYPEIKNPAWHRGQGYDISRIVVSLLKKHGYTTKQDACYLQCFDHLELRRIRKELGVQLTLIQLLSDDPPRFLTQAGLREIAEFADGIGPALSQVGDFQPNEAPVVSQLVSLAHRAGLKVHPYTVRADGLPAGVKNLGQLMELLVAAKVDGMFTDFPDKCLELVSRKPD